MKLLKREFLHKGSFYDSEEWKLIDKEVSNAIKSVVWPRGSDKFAIKPVRKGNGVKPIKEAFINFLTSKGWIDEWNPFEKKKKRDGVDIVKVREDFTFIVEWETGNISSSHRSMNKMCKALLSNNAIGGILILPSREFYNYLTDRIGNEAELIPYYEVWSSLPLALNTTDAKRSKVILAVYVIEYDILDDSIDLIRKMTDGFGQGT